MGDEKLDAAAMGAWSRGVAQAAKAWVDGLPLEELERWAATVAAREVQVSEAREAERKAQAWLQESEKELERARVKLREARADVYRSLPEAH